MRNLADGWSELGIKPAKYDKHGPLYKTTDLSKMIIAEASAGQHASRRFRTMSKELEAATKEIEAAQSQFEHILATMLTTEKSASEQVKKISGNVRASANDLANGLLKVQKTADFAALERQVNLLERAAAALSTLSELEKGGKLDLILKAMK